LTVLIQMTIELSFSKSLVQPLDPVESTPDVESISIDFLTNLSLLTTPTPTPTMLDVFNDGRCGGGDPADDDVADDDADDDDDDEAQDVVDDDALF